MLNKKIIGLFVLGLALSSPLQSANAALASPGAPSSELTCYEPKQCKSGYTLSTDGKSCVASDPCKPANYDAFVSALSNSKCTTVTLAADINGTSDTKTSDLSVSNKILDGAGYTLKLSRSLYPNNSATIKNLTLINNNADAINLVDYETIITLSNLNIESTKSAIDVDETYGASLTGNNSIKVSGVDGCGLEFSEMGDFKLASGATLNITATNGATGMSPGMSMPFDINGTLNINVTDGYAINGRAGTGYLNVNGTLNINHDGPQSPIYSAYTALRVYIPTGGKMDVKTNSISSTFDLPDYALINIAGGTLNIEAPIANGAYFMDIQTLKLTSSNSKLITTSTGSRTLSDTDAGVNLILSEAKKGATWQVKSSGFNKTWKAQQDYTGQTAVIKAPQSPDWCDATTGCTPTCATGTYADKSVCDAENFNSPCELFGNNGCYSPNCQGPYVFRLMGACNYLHKGSSGSQGNDYGVSINNKDASGCGFCGYPVDSCEDVNANYHTLTATQASAYECATSYDLYLNGTKTKCYTNCTKTPQYCEYSSIEDCESKNNFAICEEVSGSHIGGGDDGFYVCPEVVGCQEGMGLNSMGDCEPVQAKTCETTDTGSAYMKYATGMSCPSGFSLGDPIQIDGMNCTACCKHGGKLTCENSNPGFNCKQIGNTMCYEPSTCKSGYTLSDDGSSCVADGSSGSGDYGVCEYSTQAACENANPGFKCVESVDLSSSNQGHSAGSGN